MAEEILDRLAISLNGQLSPHTVCNRYDLSPDKILILSTVVTPERDVTWLLAEQLDSINVELVTYYGCKFRNWLYVGNGICQVIYDYEYRTY
jgi:hypothetical protein